MFYKTVCIGKRILFNLSAAHTHSCVPLLWHLCAIAVALPYECKPTLAIHGGFRDADYRRAPCITFGFYEPINRHRGTVISAILVQ